MQPEGVSNKEKSIMSHPGNTPNADGTPEKHRLVGQLVEVYQKYGSMSRGHLQHGADGIVLALPSAFLKQATGAFKSKPPTKTVNIPADEIRKVLYLEKHLWRSGEKEDADGTPKKHRSVRQPVEVYQKSGFMSRGHLQHGADGIVLEMPSAIFKQATGEFESMPPTKTVNIPANEILTVLYLEKHLWRSGEEEDELLSGVNSATELRSITLHPRRLTNVAKDVPLYIPTHGYGPGSFSLHGLPDPYLGEVVGLVGRKSTGKTTCLMILAGLVKPNLGRFEDPPEWDEIIAHFDTDHIKTYLTRLQSNKLKIALKGQDVTSYRRALTVRTCLEESKGVEFESMEELVNGLNMMSLLDKHVKDLSDAELQIFAIASTVVQSADVYLFDEPTIYLDAMQKFQFARVILSVVKKPHRYIFVTDNDIGVLDLICEYISNTSYSGRVTTSWQFPLDFKNPSGALDFENPILTPPPIYEYSERIVKGYRTCLHVMGGELRSSEITVVLGNRHTGKTFFLEWLSVTDNLGVISYRPQRMVLFEARPFDTVATYLLSLIPTSYVDCFFQELVLNPLGLMKILDKRIKEVSQSTLQKIAIASCLGKERALVFLLDEPSIHLDAAERVIVSKTIKDFISHTRTSALVVEQDVLMAINLADRVIMVQAEPGVRTVHYPVSRSTGMNSYLSNLNITCRGAGCFIIARMNKPGSVEDMEQRACGGFLA